MLVLTRKCEGEIVIGDSIRLRVLSTSANTVRLGIEAPANVRIVRGELANKSPRLPTDDETIVGFSPSRS